MKKPDNKNTDIHNHLASAEADNYITLGSLLNNETDEFTNLDIAGKSDVGYPDFFEDTDFMNHYLW